MHTCSCISAGEYSQHFSAFHISIVICSLTWVSILPLNHTGKGYDQYKNQIIYNNRITWPQSIMCDAININVCVPVSYQYWLIGNLTLDSKGHCPLCTVPATANNMVWECILINRMAALHKNFVPASNSSLTKSVLLLKQQKVPYLLCKLTTADTCLLHW